MFDLETGKCRVHFENKDVDADIDKLLQAILPPVLEPQIEPHEPTAQPDPQYEAPPTPRPLDELCALLQMPGFALPEMHDAAVQTEPDSAVLESLLLVANNDESNLLFSA